MIKADKGVERLDRGERGAPPFKYPWKTMKVGESFRYGGKSYNGAHVQASLMSLRTGLKFRPGRAKDGIRIWRVA